MGHERFFLDIRMDAWKVWLSDVSAALAATSLAVDLALRSRDEQALAAAQRRSAAARASMWAVRDGWPGPGPRLAPARTIIWVYFRKLKQGPAMPLLVGFPTYIFNYDATTWSAAFEVAVEAHAAVSISILLGFCSGVGAP